MKLLAMAAALCVVAVLPPAALAADDYPAKPIRLIVPFTAGGGSDQLARLLASRLGPALGQTVVVMNRPGAGGSIGTREAAQSAPDGYTLLIATSSTHGINPWIYRDLGYDVGRDFTPITMLATTDYGIAVPPNSPHRTLADLLAAGKSGRIDYASTGNGTTSHLAAASLATTTKTPFQHVPYKSSGPALTDLMGGQVAFFFDNTSVLLPHAQAGKLRILATSGSRRSGAASSLPTIAEAGVPGYEIIGWWCLLAPAGLPQALLDRLNGETVKILEAPEVRNRLTEIGNEPFTTSPAATRDYMARQLALFRTLVESAGAKAD